MNLENDFAVDAPIERTWETLLDVARVARCLPGATLESEAKDGVYRGNMQVKLGPMTMRYEGTAHFTEIDELNRTTKIVVKSKEGKGQGIADATIHSRLERVHPEATRVTVQTDLRVTGRAAQFGRGIMEDVASRMMSDFAEQLEQEILRSSTPAATNGAGEPPAAPPAPQSLRLGSLLRSYLVSRLRRLARSRRQGGTA